MFNSGLFHFGDNILDTLKILTMLIANNIWLPPPKYEWLYTQLSLPIQNWLFRNMIIPTPTI